MIGGDNIKQKRHAYLIMAHHKFDILEEILKDLDDERNDIFLHIDKKAKNINIVNIKSKVARANLILTKRMNVYWGGYSQIECICMLLQTATEYCEHDYYHFMVGVEFPLKSQNYIHNFFEKNYGYEFIGFDNYDLIFLERVKFYHPFNSYARNNNFIGKILNKIRIASVKFQKTIGFSYNSRCDIEFKKGNANWSITHKLALYILSKRKEIKKIYRHSFCGDEIFIHTLVFNSNFWNVVYDKKDEYHSSMRMMTWTDSHNQYHICDLKELIESDRLFARKIDGDDALELIQMIKYYRRD